jgi:molybdopterin/thiamine biosynthesis adenylyltransferase
VLPGIVGSIQAIETIKLILGLGDSLRGRLLAYDALEQSFREYKVRVDPTNEVTYANRDRIVVAELDGMCMPHPLAPPAG